MGYMITKECIRRAYTGICLYAGDIGNAAAVRFKKLKAAEWTNGIAPAWGWNPWRSLDCRWCESVAIERLMKLESVFHRPSPWQQIHWVRRGGACVLLAFSFSTYTPSGTQYITWFHRHPWPFPRSCSPTCQSPLEMPPLPISQLCLSLVGHLFSLCTHGLLELQILTLPHTAPSYLFVLRTHL